MLVHIGLPQFLWMTLTAIGLAVIASKDGEKREYDFPISVTVVTLIELPLLWWGGFFG